ncbi:MAG: 2,3-bisphosphoglycerate-independent phosphoglycerate mutase [candidate division Zixibacteria bacterium]|jgi:2,3-bisphosphoglycerate-independent phosphoglycerate mutase|nr:2,3-bisphosphoglycerate-independent phosphoglycerate mutase [candidate division Zixibacteria bacterium]
MTVLLCVMDGFGLRESAPDNAIAAANKPNFNRLIAEWPFTKIDGSGRAVGLPHGQMGNSEVGHLNLGAGRVVYQDITRIDKAIEDGDFFTNPALAGGMEMAARTGAAVHLYGLVSDGKVHSSLDHLYALAELAKQKNVSRLFLHALMDGRDTSPTSGAGYMRQVLSRFNEVGIGKVATVGGRYYGMDRDRRWERTEKHFHTIVGGQGEVWNDPVAAIEASYENDVTDEFIVPVVIDNGDRGLVRDGDVFIMFNFRADRMRQMAYILARHHIDGYTPPTTPSVGIATMTNYDVKLTGVEVAFDKVKLTNILGEVIARAGIRQLRTAETEKYAHVTFFFNGGFEKQFEGEDRYLVPSPKVATYDLKPEMSSVEVTDNTVEQIRSGKYGFVVLNYANCDMVGHTGDFGAAKAACEAVDRGLGRLLDAVKDQGGVAIVTADHGNAELMIDPDNGGPWTAHTTNLVPCVVYDPARRLGRFSLRDGGILADIAPTVLDILNLPIPDEMTGKSLIRRG